MLIILLFYKKYMIDIKAINSGYTLLLQIVMTGCNYK